MARAALRTIAIILVILLPNLACAEEVRDPIEPINRVTYEFNKIVDSLYIKPATTVYEKVLPFSARMSVTNFINNMREIPTVINGVLQGKITQALIDTGRFVINSSLGVFGFFDVAAELGILAHKEDLGMTFYTWGWKQSSYFVIPIIGPSTFRDAWGILGNLYLQAPTYFRPALRNEYYFLVLIDRRQDLHEIESMIGVAGVEYYNLVRYGYYQHRAQEISGIRAIDSEPTPGQDQLGDPPD